MHAGEESDLTEKSRMFIKLRKSTEVSCSLILGTKLSVKTVNQSYVFRGFLFFQENMIISKIVEIFVKIILPRTDTQSKKPIGDIYEYPYVPQLHRYRLIPCRKLSV